MSQCVLFGNYNLYKANRFLRHTQTHLGSIIYLQKSAIIIVKIIFVWVPIKISLFCNWETAQYFSLTARFYVFLSTPYSHLRISKVSKKFRYFKVQITICIINQLGCTLLDACEVFKGKLYLWLMLKLYFLNDLNWNFLVITWLFKCSISTHFLQSFKNDDIIFMKLENGKTINAMS